LGALSDERTGLPFARVTFSSNKPVVSMYNLHFTCKIAEYVVAQLVEALCYKPEGRSFDFR
jgi:hypothetical protein